MFDPDRLGGTSPVCLRTSLTKGRFTKTGQICLHPQARAAFEVFRNIRVSARMPAVLADSLLGVPSGKKGPLIIGNFSSVFAFHGAQEIPVFVCSEINEDEVAFLAWAEVLRLAHGQLQPRHGFKDLHRALQFIPADVSRAIMGEISDLSLARHLSVDVSRFQGGRK